MQSPDQKTIQLPEAHTVQRVILDDETRFRIIACGRRWGKTELGKRAIIAAAARGERSWWIAPTYGMAGQVWRDLRAACAPDERLVIEETAKRITFPKQGWLEIHSAHKPDLLRGAGLDFAVLDEAAFMDAAIWPEIVRPMLVERKGRALFLSSPNGLNWFHDLYLKAAGGMAEWRAFHFSSYDNPLLDPAELEGIRAQTPDRIWREEYLAAFVADAGQVFRGLDEAASAPLDAQPQANTRYIIGCDWGREGDYTALVVLDADRRQVVALDRFNQVRWSLQRGRLAALYERWRPAAIWAEANSIGSPNIEALQQEGLPVRPFTTTLKSKAPLIEALALALERGDLALVPDAALLGELAAYRLERLPAGAHRYSAPSGGHDDLVIALALAWHGARQGGSMIDFV